MNKFQDIVAFVRVAELGSFTGAAHSLSVSPSAITKSLARIEADLGVQLLHRTTRQIHLTEDGTVFFERCVSVLGEMDAAEAQIRGNHIEPSGTVRISVTPSFGRKTIIPALHLFYSRYPKMVLELSFKVRSPNPVEGGFDLAVYSGRLADSGLVTRTLVRGPLMTVASPAYLEKMGAPKVPADLVRHNCIVGASSGPFGPAWQFRGQNGRDEVVRVAGSLSVDSGDVVREAALVGLGIAHATYWIFRRDIEQGRLIRLLPDFEVDADPISIVFPAHRHVPAKVRAVVDFLLEITAAPIS